MSDRREFEMTQAQFDAIMDASKPTPAMFLSGGQPMGSAPREALSFGRRPPAR